MADPRMMCIPLAIRNFCLACLFLFNLTVQAGAETYTFSAMQGVPYQKALAEVLKQAFKKAGHELKVVYLPGKRSLFLSNGGKYDGEVGRVLGTAKDYTNLLHIPVIIGKVEGVAFSLEKGEIFTGWEMMRTKAVGLQRGNVWSEEATKENSNRLFVDDLDSLFKILEAGRVRYVFGNTRHLAFIRNKGYSVYMLHPPIAEIGIYPHIHVKNANLISIIHPILREMKNSGEIDRIRDEFLMKEMKTAQ